MKNILNIVAIQNNYNKNISSNINTASMLIGKYGKEVDVILFPELFSTGYFMDKEYLEKNAVSKEGDFLKIIRNCAFEHNVNIVMPFLERDGEKIYNSVAIINRMGLLEGIKRKAINWKSELGYILEADIKDNLEVYDVDGFKIGVLICYEASFPELARVLANKGCEAILVPAYWNRNALHHWDVQLRARALDNNVYVIGVNGLIEDRSCGHTMMVAPDGIIVNSLGFEEGILLTKLDRNHFKEMRKKVPYFTDYEDYIKKTGL